MDVAIPLDHPRREAMIWPHPLDVIQYARSSYYYNNVYMSVPYEKQYEKEQSSEFFVVSFLCKNMVVLETRQYDNTFVIKYQ